MPGLNAEIRAIREVFGSDIDDELAEIIEQYEEFDPNNDDSPPIPARSERQRIREKGEEAFAIQQEREDAQSEPDRFGDITAEVGELQFKPEFSDPDVDVNHERETADHEIVTGHSAYRDNGTDYVVQALGRRPPDITIDGWIPSSQLDIVDRMVQRNRVNVITARWTGIAVPESVDIPYTRTFHENYGWIFNITIELIGVSRNELLDASDQENPEFETAGIGLDDNFGTMEPAQTFDEFSENTLGF